MNEGKICLIKALIKKKFVIVNYEFLLLKKMINEWNVWSLKVI